MADRAPADGRLGRQRRAARAREGLYPATGRPCNTAENQFNIGWVTPALTTRTGSVEFIRFRIRFDPDTFFGVAGRQFGAKFILHGTRGSERWIVHLYPPYENNGCTLGFEAYDSMGWTPPKGQWYRARQDWGLRGEWRDPPQANRYAAFTPNVNISWSCAPAVLVTSSNHPSPPKPQANGAAAIDGWYHLQFQAIPGEAGASGLRSWANNNDQAKPSAERLNMPEALSASALTQGVSVGGYWGMAHVPGHRVRHRRFRDRRGVRSEVVPGNGEMTDWAAGSIRG